MNKRTYAEYLRSEKWFSKRHAKYMLQEKDELGRFLCDGCKQFFHQCRTEVHHLTYERVGNENLEDLEVLCEECHQKQHPDKKRTPFGMNFDEQ